MAFTLAALLLTVAPLKTALFSYDAARASFDTERDRFASDLKVAESKTDDVRKNYASTSAKLNTTNAQLNDSNAKLNDTGAKLEEARDSLNKAEQGAKAAVKNQQAAKRAQQSAKRSELSALATASAAKNQASTALAQASTALAQARGARASLSALTRTLDQKKSDLNRVQINLTRATARVNTLSHQVNTLTNRSRSLQKQVSAREEQVFYQGKQIFQQGKELYRSGINLASAKVRLTGTQAQLRRVRVELATAQKQQGQLKEDALLIASNANALADNANALAYHDIALPVDQTLTEQRLPSRLSPGEAQAQLRALLEHSQEAARNFLKNNDNESLAKKVEVVPLGAYEDNGKAVYLNPDQWLKAFGNLIARQKQSVLLRMVVSSNYSSDTLKNFPFVEARLLFVQQTALYEDNQVIYEGTIDGTQGEASIYGALTNLIEVARRRAVSHGASPPLSPEAPTFFASDTGERIFEAKSQVQKANRRVLVRILAARDLNTAEPLQIRFQVDDSNTA